MQPRAGGRPLPLPHPHAGDTATGLLRLHVATAFHGWLSANGFRCRRYALHGPAPRVHAAGRRHDDDAGRWHDAAADQRDGRRRRSGRLSHVLHGPEPVSWHGSAAHPAAAGGQLSSRQWYGPATAAAAHLLTARTVK